MQESRAGNASRNIFFGMLLKGYQVLLPFIMRTVIMYYMGIEYLGLNSLFGSILWVLNLAELGVGAAMVYSMYQPIIDGNKQEICALLKLYRRYYRVIGLVIGVVGMVLTPFIPSLIKEDVPADTNVYVVYWLNLLCTVLSYWLFAYKNSLLVAHQRNDVASKVTIVTNTFQYAIQFLIVIFLKDYYYYLIASIVTQVFTNIITAYYATKMYPDYNPDGELDKEVVSKVNQRIKDLFTVKLGTVIVSSVDSIVISAFLGLTMVGIYNNYNYIVTAAMSIVRVVFVSCTAGIGNSILTDTKEKNYNDIKKLTLLIAWLAGCFSVCLLCLYQPFMVIWMGKDLTLEFLAVICFVVAFFVDQINYIFITYKDAAGIWHQDRFRPIVTALVNLTLNLITVHFWGIYGVLLSTIISVVFVGMPWILHNLFTVLFKRSMREYVIKLLLYLVVTVAVSAITLFISSPIQGAGIGSLILKGIVCFVVSNMLFFLAYFKTKEFSQIKDLAKRVLKR